MSQKDCISGVQWRGSRDSFRGDQFVTMEAKYDAGTFAGPHDWTSFKEFDQALAPNYTDRLTAFFANVKDNQRVPLTFHYWSGTKVSYDPTKSGTAVTGTTA